MANLSKTNFDSQYGAAGLKFPDNTTQLITEGTMREFGQNASDSFLFLRDRFYNTVNSTTGTNSYVFDFPYIPTTYVTMVIFVKFGNASSAAVTLNVSGLGAKKVYIDEATQAGSGDIAAGRIYLLAYDTALDSAAGGFQILGGVSSGGGSSFQLEEWDFATSGASPGDFPADTTKMYEITDDSVYPSGTWMAHNGTAWRTK